MADQQGYKYQISIGWSKHKGWHLLGNIPADKLDELDEGVKEILDRIENVKIKLEEKNSDDNLNEAFDNVAKGKPDKECSECGGTMTYKEGVSNKTKKPYKGYFCNKDGSDTTCKSVEWLK